MFIELMNSIKRFFLAPIPIPAAFRARARPLPWWAPASALVILALAGLASPTHAVSGDTIADYVWGEPDFNTNSGGASSTLLRRMYGSPAIDSAGRLYIPDQNNHRIIRHDNPLVDAVADGIYGQPNFDTNTSGTSSSRMKDPMQIAFDSAGRMYVADQGNNRILRFNTPLTDTVASAVYGQPDFTSHGAAVTQTGLTQPSGLVIDSSGRLYISELNANRVVRHDNPLSDTVADAVFGQPNFTTGGGASTTLTSLISPLNLAMDSDGRLYVGSNVGGSARVIRHDNPLVDTVADAVFGQPNYTTATGGTTQTALASPHGVAVDSAGRLYIVDHENNRVLRHDNPLVDTVADHVFGQPNFTTATSGISSTLFNEPSGIAIDASGRIYISEYSNRRVVAFDINAPPAPVVDTTLPNIWYVNDSSTAGDSFTFVTGNSGNNGLTPTTPKRFLNNLEGLLTAGDTIYVDAGTYREVDTFTIDTNSIWVIGKDSGATVIDFNNQSADGARAIYAKNKHSITIVNLGVIRGRLGIYFENVDHSFILNDSASYSGNTGILLAAGSETNTVTGNAADANSYAGIYLDASSGNTVSANAANENGNGGIFAASSSGNTIDSNITRSNGTGIHMTSSPRNKVRGNAAHSNTDVGIYVEASSENTFIGNAVNMNGGTGLSLGSNSDTNTVIGNTVNFNTDYGIVLGSSSGNSIIGNTARENRLYGLYLSSSVNNVVSQNTLDSNARYQIYIDETSSADTVFKNNFRTSPANPDSGVLNDALTPFDLTRNWWGTTDTAEIRARIVGATITYSPFRLGLVDTAPGADTVATKAPGSVVAVRLSATTAEISWANVTVNEEGSPFPLSLAGFRVYRSRTSDTTFWVFRAAAGSSASSLIDSGLSAGESWYYRVTSEDAKTPFKNESFYSDSIGRAAPWTTSGADTAPPFPADELSATALETGGIRIVWKASPSSDVVEYRLYWDSGTRVSPDTLIFTIAVTAGQGGSFVTAVLPQRAEFRFKVLAIDSSGNISGNAYVSAFTDTKTYAFARPVLSKPNAGDRLPLANRLQILTSLEGTAAEIAAVSTLTHQVRTSPDGAWSNMTASSGVTRNANPGATSDFKDEIGLYRFVWDATALALDSYEIRVIATSTAGETRASNAVGIRLIDPLVDSATSYALVTTESFTNFTMINVNRAETVTITNNADTQSVQISLPNGAFANAVDTANLYIVVSFTRASPFDSSFNTTTEVKVLDVVEVKISNGDTLLSGGGAALVTMTFRDDDGDGSVDGTRIPWRTLRLFRHTGRAGDAWTERPIVARGDPSPGVPGFLRTTTEHFSFFQLVGAAASAGIGSVMVAPNPFRPNDGSAGNGQDFTGAAGTGVYFLNLPASVRIRLFTVIGRKVFDFSTMNSTGQVQWDVRNEDRRPVGSGVYLYIVTDLATGQQVTGKLVVIR